jgi:SAM-dependent methyltransferase
VTNAVTPEEVDRFLNTNTFSGYQSVPLPHGRRVPGRDRSNTADIVFKEGVRDKRVLDVGTYYGAFAYEAMRRGAADAVGLEPDRERYEVARRIAELNGGYEILNVSAEDYRPTRMFEVVVALNVLHHVLDPIGFISHLARLCSETLIVEFRMPEDPGCIESILSRGRDVSLPQRVVARGWSRLLQVAGAGYPLMAVGNRKYHRVFYFSRRAFYNLFVIHLSEFRDVDFAKSPGRGRRVIAFCRVSD